MDVWVPPRTKDCELVALGDGGGWVRLFEVSGRAGFRVGGAGGWDGVVDRVRGWVRQRALESMPWRLRVQCPARTQHVRRLSYPCLPGAAPACTLSVCCLNRLTAPEPYIYPACQVRLNPAEEQKASTGSSDRFLERPRWRYQHHTDWVTAVK